MSWQIFIGLSVILYSVSVLLQRLLLKDSHSNPVASAITFQFTIALIIAAVGWGLGQWQVPDLRPLPPNLALMSLLYMGGNLFLFKSLKTTEASIFTILFATRGVFTILASTLVLQEGLGFSQLVGALLIFAGVVVVNWKTNQIKFSKGEWLAIGAALCFGLANTNDRILVSQLNVYVFATLGFLLPGLLIAILYPKEITQVAVFFQPSMLKKMLLLCAFYAASAVTFFLALQSSPNSSQVAVVNLTSVILTVLLAVMFLKERSDLARKMVGAGLSFVGLLLVGM